MNRPGSSLSRSGLLYALAAYGLWGVMPIYFKQIGSVSSIDIVAHRVIWSLAVLAALLGISRSWDEVRTAVSNSKSLGILCITAILIATNWLLFVYAVNNGQILAGSLGYYLNPLANVLLGRFILGERLHGRQWLAVGIAAAGVAVLAVGALGSLWISLTLCLTFATYGLLRKIVAVESLAGLSIETAICFPVALGWLLLGGAAGTPMFDHPPAITGLLVAAGLVSTVPLLCFTAAARRLPYSTLGMIQFLAPTLQFILAVTLYDEKVSSAHAVAFACIWTALAIYVGSLVGRRRKPGTELTEP